MWCSDGYESRRQASKGQAEMPAAGNLQQIARKTGTEKEQDSEAKREAMREDLPVADSSEWWRSLKESWVPRSITLANFQKPG